MGKIGDERMNIAIVGFGYVGKQIGSLASNKGHHVDPIDIGDSYKPIGEADVAIICLPTPAEHGNPDYRVLIAGMAEMVQHINPDKDTLIILESTVGIGFTKNVVGSHFPENSVTYSPERISPGTKHQFPIHNCKLVSGLTKRARQRAEDFYQSLGIEIYRCPSTDVAEAAKLMENAFRAVNIAFANEMWRLCEQRKVDIRQVIQAASSKGFGFMPFQPGAGVGGHCIPEDPHYLDPPRHGVISAALEVNKDQPAWVVEQVEKRILGGIKGKRFLIIGGVYKENTDDRRNAPGPVISNLLYFEGASVVDIYEPTFGVRGRVDTYDLRSYDQIIVTIAHDYVDLTPLHDSIISHKVFDCTGS